MSCARVTVLTEAGGEHNDFKVDLEWNWNELSNALQDLLQFAPRFVQCSQHTMNADTPGTIETALKMRDGDTLIVAQPTKDGIL